MVYIAHGKRAEAGEFYGKPGERGLYEYIPDFGEDLNDVTDPGLFLLNISTGDVSRLEVPDGIPACPEFLPGTSVVYYTAYEHMTLNLGYSHNLDRRSRLYTGDTTSWDPTPIPTTYMGQINPCPNPSGTKIAFIGVPECKSETTYVSLNLLDRETGESQQLIEWFYGG